MAIKSTGLDRADKLMNTTGHTTRHSTVESGGGSTAGSNLAPDATQAARQASMALLARASGEELKTFWQNWADKPEFEVLRGPETGLVMMRGRIGGGGAPFNVGEATVTRATVRLANGSVGHSYALGRDQEKRSWLHCLMRFGSMRPPAMRSKAACSTHCVVVSILRMQNGAAKLLPRRSISSQWFGETTDAPFFFCI